MRGIIASVTSTALLSSFCLGGAAMAQPANPSDAEIAQAETAINTNSHDVAALAQQISAQQQELNELELTMGGLAEAVNKALVDLHDAQAKAEQARQAVAVAKEDLDRTQQEIDEAQRTLNEISRSAYRRGATSVSGLAGKNTTEDALDRQTYLRTSAEKQRAAIEELDRARTAKANKESELRVARNLAEQREAEAAQAEADARAAITANAAKMEAAGKQHRHLSAELAAAQARLDAARGHTAELQNQRQEYEAFLAAEAERKQAEEAARKAEAERQAAAAARQQAEAAAKEAANQAAAQQAAQAAAAARAQEEQATAEAKATQDAVSAALAATAAAAAAVAKSQPDHATVNSPYPNNENSTGGDIAAIQGPTNPSDIANALNDMADIAAQATAPTANNTTTDSLADISIPSLDLVELDTVEDITNKISGSISGSRSEKVEMVISRAMAQIGTPYAWGGGNATGPTKGIRDGGVADSYGDFNKVGFDCSGLVLYAFAGVGISLPHYSGYQYNHGTKVPPSQMQRGDLIFYGPGGSQHVAIYLGDGQMIEAPQSGSSVKISPVRWSGMTPSVVRLI
ncbi:DIP1281 family NlpC/P60 protein [Corynebacterium caspium]|uniref:DIP1281 family NlpC/P60 protein n=1 Tax=Corynebacterium caspium TaxID=234828 RepID=UPI000A0251A4